ncbi:unnamed protein product [Macrosiphum euphorbiae]|uniref:Uncharacterized protein n=1 Tax=Macrosiphum euphorbiae TaxID=13131 RepID=A0AAV0XDU1_9HEMI|nr:unnamed protein product [Macrosiphum euphorbiae]
MYKILNETLRSNNCPAVGHLAYRIDTKTRHVRRKMASAFFLSPKISAFHDTRRCRSPVNRLIVYPTSLDGPGAGSNLGADKLKSASPRPAISGTDRNTEK